MEALYILLIKPIEILFLSIFNLFLLIGNGNVLIAIVLLSIISSVLLSKIEKIVEKIVVKEKSLQSILGKQIQLYKDKYSGYELNSAINRLYKRYSYNPVYAIRSSLGLLCQLPFLVGALFMINNNSLFIGYSVGIINDLSKPDHLLRGFNVLPFIMFFANLLNIFINPKINSIKDRNNGIIIAGSFLILLYSAPSCLLLYWTCNNVIQLINVFKYRRSFNLDEYKGWQLLILFVLSIFLYLYSVTASILVLVLFTYVLHTLFVKNLNLRNLWSIFLLSIITVTLSLIFNNCFFLFYLLPIIFIISIKFVTTIIYSEIPNSKNIFFSSAIFLSSLALVYFPLNLYLSDPTALKIDGNKLLELQLTLFETTVLFFFILKIIINSSYQSILGVVLGTFVIVFIYSRVFDNPNVGVLQEFQFNQANALDNDTYAIKDIIYFILSLFLIFIVGKSNKSKLVFSYFSIILLTGTIVCSLVPIYKCLNLGVENIDTTSTSRLNRDYANNSAFSEVPQSVYNFNTFSSDGNIIIFMLDAFTGDNMIQLLNKYPNIADQFDGFTWYEDTLTSGFATDAGLPGILGGLELHPINLNKNDKDLSLKQKVNKVWSSFFNFLMDNNYDVSVQDAMWLDIDYSKKYIKNLDRIQYNLYHHTLWDEKSQKSYWLSKNPSNVMIKQDISNFFYAYGLFSVVPNSIKSLVYWNGSWLNTIDTPSSEVDIATSSFSSMDLLPELASVKESTVKQFKFYHMYPTHGPWALNENCKITNKGDSYSHPTLEIDHTVRYHINAEYCSLQAISRFITWMKEHNIYDNSQIIVVSDHDAWDDGTRLYDAEHKYATKKEIPYLGVGSLLLVKNKNSRGNLKINSDYLMYNADVLSLIKKDLGHQVDEPWKDKNRQRYYVNSDWHGSDYEYAMRIIIKITGSIFSANNWELVDKIEDVNEIN